MTKHVNDHKLEGLVGFLTQSGHIDDLEYLAVINKVGPQPTVDQINDLWYRYLTVFIGLDGQINDMYYDFLVSLGFSGHINDMWHDFWEAFTGFEPAPAVPYEFEMPGGTIEIYQFDSFGDYELQMGLT